MPKYHIAEWYGLPFDQLLPEERVALAHHKAVGQPLKGAALKRLVDLERRSASGASLTKKELERLKALRSQLTEGLSELKPCPFKITPYPTCTKKGGVCSVRLYDEGDDNVIKPLEGERGSIRCLCPYRLHQDKTAFKHLSQIALKDPNPRLAGEVGFLEGDGGLDMEKGEDVGKIDMIIVSTLKTNELDWCAAEVQAVYFSGDAMEVEFRHIIAQGGKLTMPHGRRKPDYRSSSVKRLMPQLQIKIPTLRRWSRKMGIIVDKSFYGNLGEMRKSSDPSNADIAWVLLDFSYDSTSRIYRAHVHDVAWVTLEDATYGLTNGRPISKKAFEEKILSKLSA
ncbi:MAG: hypothetical protein C0427_14870 [Rhodobacter sp.]|nr:hypothetical protein [Rhodobacter sp.]